MFMTENKVIYSTFDINIAKGADFEIMDEHIIIYNVPITGEIVQDYNDGKALKPLNEIKKISVDNIPITLMHNQNVVNTGLVSDMTTEQKQENVKGFITAASLDRKDDSKIDDKKLYADFIIYKTDDTKNLQSKLESKDGVDVSIGFQYTQDSTPGSLDGKEYDYVQRNIRLDHLAVLIDEAGLVHEGRAAFPNFGIAADKKNNGDGKMSKKTDAFETQLNEFVNKLESENSALNREDILILLSNEIWELREPFFDSTEGKKVKPEELIKSRDDALEQVKTLDSEKKVVSDELTKVKADAEKAVEDHKKVADELQTYKDAEKAVVDEMRKDLKEHAPAQEKLFDTASDEAVKEAHAEFKKLDSTSIEGKVGASAKTEEKPMFGSKKPKGEGQ